MKNLKKVIGRAVLAVLMFALLFCARSSDAYAMKKTLTGNAKIDYIAEKMIKSAGVKDTMSDNKKVKKIYHYMTTHFKHIESKRKGLKVYYNTGKLKAEISAYSKEMKALEAAGTIKFSHKYTNELWNMKRRKGDCVDMAAIFALLCQHVGVRAGTCRGRYLNRSGKTFPHSWNWAKIDGKKYYYDVDVEIKNYKKGQGDYYWYKKTYSQARKTHRF